MKVYLKDHEVIKNKMAIKCDMCGEEVNHLRTFSFIIIGLVGGSMTIGMFINISIFKLLGALLGLGLSIKMLYDFNPKHWKHVLKKRR